MAGPLFEIKNYSVEVTERLSKIVDVKGVCGLFGVVRIFFKLTAVGNLFA